MEPALRPIEKSAKKFSLLPFTLSVGATIIFYILILKTFLPHLWSRQFENGLWPIIPVSLGFHLFNAFFEFFFHRYVLHRAVIGWLKKFYRDHTKHHALTAIFRKKTRQESDSLGTVVSHYPIIEEKQYESSFFPYWGLAGFTLFFSPLTALIQWLLPQKPILLGSFIAFAFSYCLYELLHALEHVPYEAFWKKFVESPRFGILGKKIYGFHQFHHANIKCNLAISGFFGLPVFDWLFGTYKQPRELLLDGTLAREDDFSTPVPCWFIQWLDRLVEKLKAA
ncbi:MAG: hypothetical protein Q7R65_02220 [bacterium]|nr:hypothetical protein [bacterium]